MIERIVIINDLSSPEGGASQLALESARAFAARSFKVTYLCGDHAPTDADIKFVGLSQGRLNDRGIKGALFSGLYNRNASALLMNWIERNDTPGTVYHLHGWSQILSPSIFGPLRSVMSRLVMSAHDFFATCPNGAAFDFRTMSACHRKPLGASCLTARCDRRNSAHKAWRVARSLVQSNFVPAKDMPLQLLIHAGMAPFMRNAGIDGSKLVVLPNPVVPYTKQRVTAETNRSALFVGRLEKTKGADLAARACHESGIPLIMVGEGILRSEIEKNYPSVRCVGRKAPEEIGNFAKHARTLLMPSRHMEPFGLTAVEGLWSGLPVISTDKALLADDIVRCQAGYAVDPENMEAFGRVLGDLFSCDDGAKKMSEAAFYNTKHLALSPDEWISRLLDTYTQVLSEPQPNKPAGGAQANFDGSRKMESCA